MYAQNEVVPYFMLAPKLEIHRYCHGQEVFKDNYITAVWNQNA